VRRTFIALVLLIAAAPRLEAQRLWNPDERVLITSFNEIQAIAYDGRRVYAATRNGLQIYDELGRRWLLSSTVEDGYPFMEQAIALSFDRSQGGLWLIAASGNSYLWSELSGRWDLRPNFDAPRDVRSRYPDTDPAFDILSRTLSLDPAGRRFRISAVVAADRPGRYWVGTDGNNIALADSRNLSAEWLSFGTISRGVSAIGRSTSGEVWFGSDGNDRRNGITRTDAGLQRWTSYEYLTSRAPRMVVTRILAGDTTWTASREGVHVLTPNARSWQNIGEQEGLPSDNVRAMERSGRGVWAGTNMGLALIDPASLSISWRSRETFRVNALAVRNDTVWVASDRGLLLASADSASSVTVMPGPGYDDPRFRANITSVALVNGRIAVLTAGRVYLYDSQWSEPIVLQSANRAYGLRGDGDRLIVLHPDGVEEWNAATNTSNHLSAPMDIPENPRDALRDGEFFWVATPAGAMRLRWP
jgi:ligand-binding sensor domain-containing protein